MQDYDINISDIPEKSNSKRRIRKLICASVLVAVLLLNILVGAIIYSRVAYIDLTEAKYDDMTGFYTFSDSLESVMDTEVIPSIEKINSDRAKEGLDPLSVNITFCQDADIIEGDEYSRLVHHTARQIAAKYSDAVKISYVNVEKHPSKVQKYKVTSATTIYPTDVIVEFGTEFNVHGQSSFYTLDSDTGEIWAYNGEKKFASTILSLTRADSPICALTTNHGETLFEDKNGVLTVREEYSTFIDVIRAAGYKILPLNLETDEIPESCRMMVCFAPTKDFKAFGSLGATGVSEIARLDEYLDDAKSFFYVCDASTPRLDNLEEYLSEWGIAPTRVTASSGIEENYKLFDNESSANADGSLIIGKYETAGYGASLTTDLRAGGYPPAVAFGSATAISPSEAYTKSFVLHNDDGSSKSTIYTYYNNGVSRTMYDVFTTYSSAYAEIGGALYTHASDNNLFRLLTLTEEVNQVQEDSFTLANLSSYVVSLSSTEFFKNEFLNSSAYGNADVLLATLRATSSETVPVNINFKAFYSAEIESNTYAKAKIGVTTLVLCLCPVLIFSVAGVVVCVRRKYK